MPTISSLVRASVAILKGKELPVGSSTIRASGAVWKKVKPSSADHPWIMIKPPSAERAGEAIQAGVASQRANDKSKASSKPVFSSADITDIESFKAKVTALLESSGRSEQAQNFRSATASFGSDIHRILNVAYKYVNISSAESNQISKIVRDSFAEKRTRSEALLGNQNAVGEHERSASLIETAVVANRGTAITAVTLSGVIPQLQNNFLSIEDSKYLDTLNASVDRNLIPPAQLHIVSNAIASLEHKDPAIVLKVIRNYISDSLLRYNETVASRQQSPGSGKVATAVRIAKLRILADQMETAIQKYERTPKERVQLDDGRQRKTSISDESSRLRQIQSALRAIAEALQGDKLSGPLTLIRSKKDVEAILHCYETLTQTTEDPNRKSLASNIAVSFSRLSPTLFEPTTPESVKVSGSGKVYGHSLHWATEHGLMSKAQYKVARLLMQSKESANAKPHVAETLAEADKIKRAYSEALKVDQCLRAKPATSRTKTPVVIGGKPYELFFKGTAYGQWDESSIVALRLGCKTYQDIVDAGSALTALSVQHDDIKQDPNENQLSLFRDSMKSSNDRSSEKDKPRKRSLKRSQAMMGNDNAAGLHDLAPTMAGALIRETVKTVREPSTVDEILDAKEKGKKFRDANTRVPGSRKEAAAKKKLLETSDLKAFDSVTAEKSVKKDRVLPPFDATMYRQNGEDSGLVYLKAKLYESIASKPADSPSAREAYVGTLRKVLDPILNARSIEEIFHYGDSFKRVPPYLYEREVRESIRDAIDELRTAKDQAVVLDKVLDRLGTLVPGIEGIVTPIIRAANQGGQSNLRYSAALSKALAQQNTFKSIVDDAIVIAPEIFGNKFMNLLKRSTKPSLAVWQDARNKNGKTKDQADGQYEAFRTIENQRLSFQRDSFLTKYPSVDDFRQAVTDPSNPLHRLLSGFSSTDANKMIAEEYNRRSKVIPTSRAEWDQIPGNQVKDGDWSWLNKRKLDGKKTSDFKIHDSKALPSLIRQNGRAVSKADVSPERFVKDWGFTSVQFGNYMNDKASVDHGARFVAAMKDLEDALEIDVKSAIRKGGLSLAFGARGSGSASAHYESDRKIINLTKTRGDGCLAHELAHFFDHLAAGMPPATRERDHYLSHTYTDKARTNPSALHSAVTQVMDSIKYGLDNEPTHFYSNAKIIGSPYWYVPTELFARAFESYVEDKLKTRNMKNNYLVAPSVPSDPASATSTAFRLLAYPQGAERERIGAAFDTFFKAFKDEQSWAKPYDETAPRVSSEQANQQSIGDIVLARRQRRTALPGDETV